MARRENYAHAATCARYRPVTLKERRAAREGQPSSNCQLDSRSHVESAELTAPINAAKAMEFPALPCTSLTFRSLKARKIYPEFTPHARDTRVVRCEKQGRKCMWKKLLIISVAATGLSFAVADAQARHSTHRTGVTTHSRAALHARAQMRGPHTRPRGWSHGRKVGWHCGGPPHTGCRPPGLSRH